LGAVEVVVEQLELLTFEMIFVVFVVMVVMVAMVFVASMVAEILIVEFEVVLYKHVLMMDQFDLVLMVLHVEKENDDP
jgi:hypothetical protein